MKKKHILPVVAVLWVGGAGVISWELNSLIPIGLAGVISAFFLFVMMPMLVEDF